MVNEGKADMSDFLSTSLPRDGVDLVFLFGTVTGVD